MASDDFGFRIPQEDLRDLCIANVQILKFMLRISCATCVSCSVCM